MSEGIKIDLPVLTPKVIAEFPGYRVVKQAQGGGSPPIYTIEKKYHNAMNEVCWLKYVELHQGLPSQVIKISSGIAWHAIATVLDSDDHGWREDAEIREAQIKLLKKALMVECEAHDELMDNAGCEHFGPETERCVVIAIAATEYGVAQEGDSYFDLDGMTLEQARVVNSK